MGPGEEIQTFDRLTLFGRRYFFRIIDAGNNEVLAQSEAYTSKSARDRTARRFGYGLGAKIIERKR